MAGNLIRQRGGGGQFRLGPPTNVFASATARNTYATNNPDWLARYDDNPNLYIKTTISGSAKLQARAGGAWYNIDVAITGATGPVGPTGPQPSLGNQTPAKVAATGESAGSATVAAPADHVHEAAGGLVPALSDATPQQSAASGAAGDSDAVSRGDHRHQGDGNDGGGGGSDTAAQIVAKLEGLSGDTRLDASAVKGIPDAEQIRIDEFIDADNLMVMDDYSIVASYTGTVNGSSIFAQDTYSIYYQNSSGVSQKEFLRHITVGWQFLLHRQSSPPQYVFSDVTDVEWQDTNGDATDVLADTVTFKFTVSIDTERGLDAYGELTAGTIRIHWKIPLGETYVEVDGSNVTPELVEAIQGNNEDEALGVFTRVALGQEQLGDNRFGVGGQLVFSVAPDANYQSNTSDTNDAKLWRAAKERAWVRFGNGWEIEIVSLSSRYTGSGGRAQYSIGSWDVLAGSAPGLNSSTSVTVIGEDVHRGQIVEAAYRDSAENIAGKGGSDGDVWMRGSGDSNAGWQTFKNANGATLPASPEVGHAFILTAADGARTAGLYFCRTAGTWEKA